mmetsp:Transcript_49521/g.111360  ORF Transcript_49521/g.111360 Transcript_49521/m.111360 type:complete len:430 (-) Transcript_49521:272-1561(-)|eukprot:CAMPEP_0181225208 /NCGR_PEP_ID=MMETSP1096-20121128/31560_1 /TAXON_ID=156174 ORGANISM="Chrysochromulina ericina, Strain CCMP281" /NCGR_SAMPLE_ID=MMETSP1096 /ASSEMBLY_ACC=CAM_ASM_000453 /LENGTH=429 /DNA_ID=CAMNT_0023318387 /DNA_START=57 /DNA_END=1346 /DNA_ORIENTATION=+
MLPLAIGIVALLPSPMAARSKDGLLSAPTLRCSIEAKLLSPAYDGTRRYAAADWVQNIKTFPRSIVLKRISSPLMFNFLVTFVTCWLYAVAGLPSLLPPLPHTLLGSALGLLLVFRTNAAYDRFWEARKQWGIVSSECRQLAGLACTFMTPLQALPMLTLIAVFPVVVKSYLRGEGDQRRLKALLVTEEFAALSSSANQPQYVLARLRQLTKASSAAGVTEKEREMLLKSVGVLGDCVATCERIFNTPIPLAYSRHTSRFLVLYTSTLPLVLVGALGWATLPVMLTISWALFGILEIGNIVEEPFTAVADFDRRALLPLTEVCRTIRRDVRAIAQFSQVARNYSVPTIQRNPKTLDLPDGFKSLRALLKADKAAEVAAKAAEAAAKAAEVAAKAASKAAAKEAAKAAAKASPSVNASADRITAPPPPPS